MPLFTGTQQQYYNNSQSFIGDGSTAAFTLTFSPLPTLITDFKIFVNGSELNTSLYDGTPYNASTGVITFDTAPVDGASILVRQTNFGEQTGNYQFIGIDDIINNFIVSYIGEDKIIPKARRADVAFHAQRGIQELSYDTFKSIKGQEIEIPPSLTMKLPHDYVNYVKLAWKDSSGIEHVIYPTGKTSNPTAILQAENFDYNFDSDGSLLVAQNSDSLRDFSNTAQTSASDPSDGLYDFMTDAGSRFGISPEHAQSNGVFYIDSARGTIHFSSDLSAKTVILKYISDSLGTDAEMIVHKFAEEAMYKYMAHAILSTRANVQEYIVARFKKEKFTAIRTAKLRLSNLKIEELSQVMRGKSKQIKH
tara:strand:+ start:653 stop:1744 length:1092 start_codon:yes stop_codon:yes gene_type:complete